MAGAQCRFGHSRRSVSAARSQDSVPSFALRHAPEGIGFALVLRQKRGRAEHRFDADHGRGKQDEESRTDGQAVGNRFFTI